MSLRQELKNLSGNRRRFFLLRMADMDTKTALKLCGVVRGTYNSWLQNSDFVELYRKRNEFPEEYKKEAVQLLRRDNQLEAVLLESKILTTMKKELDTGEYKLLKSHLAKEVYSKLMGELDAQPQSVVLSWEQKLQQIINNPPKQIEEGEVINGEFETTDEQTKESQESQLIQETQ